MWRTAEEGLSARCGAPSLFLSNALETVVTRVSGALGEGLPPPPPPEMTQNQTKLTSGGRVYRGFVSCSCLMSGAEFIQVRGLRAFSSLALIGFSSIRARFRSLLDPGSSGSYSPAWV